MSIRELRECTGLSQNKFAAMFGIPAATVKDWEYGRRNPPSYVVDMIKELSLTVIMLMSVKKEEKVLNVHWL